MSPFQRYFGRPICIQYASVVARCFVIMDAGHTGRLYRPFVGIDLFRFLRLAYRQVSSRLADLAEFAEILLLVLNLRFILLIHTVSHSTGQKLPYSHNFCPHPKRTLQ